MDEKINTPHPVEEHVHKGVIALLIIFSLIIFGGIIYYLTINAPTATNLNDQTTWKTYKDKETCLAFKYPRGSTIIKDEQALTIKLPDPTTTKIDAFVINNKPQDEFLQSIISLAGKFEDTPKLTNVPVRTTSQDGVIYGIMIQGTEARTVAKDILTTHIILPITSQKVAHFSYKEKGTQPSKTSQNNDIPFKVVQTAFCAK